VFGKSFFQIAKNTNMMEGDIIRLFSRVLDSIRQVQEATDDEMLRSMLSNCKDKINACLSDVSLI
jgi:superfamily II RNA helicase